jgi:hypothetical protein
VSTPTPGPASGADDRLIDLLLAQEAGDLDAHGRDELARLVATPEGARTLRALHAAGAVATASAMTDRLAEAAVAHFANAAGGAGAASASAAATAAAAAPAVAGAGWSLGAWAGAGLLAATVALSVYVGPTLLRPAPATRVIESPYIALSQQPGTVRAPLQAAGDLPGAHGEVWWSGALQQGLLFICDVPETVPGQTRLVLQIRATGPHGVPVTIESEPFDLVAQPHCLPNQYQVPFRPTMPASDPTLFTIVRRATSPQPTDAPLLRSQGTLTPLGAAR